MTKIKKVFLTAVACFYVLILCAANSNAADQTWSLAEERYAGINTGGWSVPALADIDADGDMDMFVGGEWKYIYFYRNDGDRQNPQWNLITNRYADFKAYCCASPNLVDIDSDGDYDLFVSDALGTKQIYFYRNDGTPQVPQWTYVPEFDLYAPHPGCSHIATFVDIDGDEDLDIFWGECDWTAQFFENVGDKYNPQYLLRVENFFYENFGIWYGNYVAFKDIDIDGDYDIFVSGRWPKMAFIRNIGDRFNPQWTLETLTQEQFPVNNMIYYPFPVFVDIDDDGKDEIIMGNVAGYLSFYDDVFQQPTISISMDIKPGSYPNSINLGSKGVVPVAVFTTGEFDASKIDISTVTFAGALPVRSTTEDINGDGLNDMIFHFFTKDLSLDGLSTIAVLEGKTVDGAGFKGEDSVNIVPRTK